MAADPRNSTGLNAPTGKDVFIKEMFKSIYSIQGSIQSTIAALDKHAMMGKVKMVAVRSQMEGIRKKIETANRLPGFDKHYFEIRNVVFRGDYTGYVGLITLIDQERVTTEHMYARVKNHICWQMLDA